MRRWLLALAICLTALPALAEVRRFSDDELIDGFMKTVFGAEYGAHRAGDGADRVKRYARPVRVVVEYLPSPAMSERVGRIRKAQAEAVVRQLAARIRGVRITIVPRLSQANLLVLITDRRHYMSVGRTMFGEDAGFMRNTICSGMTSWDDSYRLYRGTAIVVGDAGTDIFTGCVAEEVLQVLGPVNDDSSLAYSTFNDRNELAGFPLFDQFILNMLYHPRVRPGMTREQVLPVLTDVIRDIRPRLEREAGRRNGTAGHALTGMHFD